MLILRLKEKTLLEKLLRLNNKRIPAIIFLGIFALACSQEEQHNEKGKDVIRLSYWCASNPRETELAKELVAEWNKNTEEQIEYLREYYKKGKLNFEQID